LRDEIEAKPATIERRLVTLKSYFAWREDRNSALPSPFADLRISIRIPRRLPRPIDRDTLRAVLQAGGDPIAPPSKPGEHDSKPASEIAVTILIIKMLIVTGLRISELTNVNVRDISPDGSQILVRGKGNKERIVFVPNRALQEELKHYLVALYAQGGSSAPLFLNTEGRRLRSATFRKRLRALSKRLGIEPHLTPHRFRHSAATLLIEEGIDIRMVQALLGHASLRTTEIYVRVSNHALRRALERADVLSELC
ncbi:hypothetical protein A3731_36440, partial [Roseovarius sp. HI0049]